MALVTIPNRPAGSDQRSIEQILANFDAVTAQVNGNLDSSNIAGSLGQSAEVNTTGQTVKGVSIIAATDTISSPTYAVLAHPDQVANIVLPTNGLIEVMFQAAWSATSNGGASAGIFLNNIAATIASGSGQASIIAQNQGTATAPLATYAGGLGTVASGGFTGDVTTGQLVGFAGTPFNGGPCHIFAAAGTYTVSIQFRVTAGSATVANRKLWVRALSYT